MTPLSFFFPYAPTAAHAKRDKARRDMVEIFSKVIQARRASGATQDTRTDILQVSLPLCCACSAVGRLQRVLALREYSPHGPVPPKLYLCLYQVSGV